jgi:hypothetical protein
MVWPKSSWGGRAQIRERGQHGDCRGHEANDVAFSQVPERRIRHTPNTHCAARTARAYRRLSLVSAVMPAGKVAAANGLLPSDLMGQPPLREGATTEHASIKRSMHEGQEAGGADEGRTGL